MSTPSYDEKRKERRFPVSSDVKMMLANKRIVNGVCKNISGSGMLVRAERAIRVGAKLQLEIQEGRIDFKADAVVVRAEVVDDSHWLGLEVNKKLPS